MGRYHQRYDEAWQFDIRLDIEQCQNGDFTKIVILPSEMVAASLDVDSTWFNQWFFQGVINHQDLLGLIDHLVLGGPPLGWMPNWSNWSIWSCKIVRRNSVTYLVWFLVGGLNPSEKTWKSIGMIIPNIWDNRKCSKPPTRILSLFDSCLELSRNTHFGPRMKCWANPAARPLSAPRKDKQPWFLSADHLSRRISSTETTHMNHQRYTHEWDPMAHMCHLLWQLCLVQGYDWP